MSLPVLVTKLFVPRPRPSAVQRPRLIERLNEGLQRKLTLIAAPAGFGKTTLVSSWVLGCGRPVAWLSLDEGDNNLVRFLLHMVAALQTATPGLAAGAAEALLSSAQTPAETLLSAVVNEIAGLDRESVLVLDDYHVLDSAAIDGALTFLLEHMPPQLHLVIATREDPQLPLSRLRVQGQLTEVRAADLRFTNSEGADFLNQVMALGLSAADVAALEDRTEGWIAGLQLAALSLQGHHDVPRFIHAFAGDHRYIADYLIDEVLQRQPPEVRMFLLQTSILERLTGSLCDAVTGQQGGAARLEALVRGNFFVVPLDDQRHWYRYHHLFADVLTAHLRAENADEVATLHRRASMWYEQQAAVPEAIRHALAAEDFPRAASLIEKEIPELRRTRQEAAALGWLRALPEEVLAVRPVLSAGYAWALLISGVLDGVDAHLQVAERWLETAGTQAAEMVVVDRAEYRGLPASIAVWRAAQSLAVGDLAGTVSNATRARDLAGEDDHPRRGAAAGLLGLACWAMGDLESAHQAYADCMHRMHLAGNRADVLGCAVAMADIRVVQGRRRDAMRTLDQALETAVAERGPMLRGTADVYVGLSELHREQHDLTAALRLLAQSKEVGEIAGLPRYRFRWCVAMARILQAQGDLAGAIDLLDEAERLYVSDYLPNVAPVAAVRTRVWIGLGRLDEAATWAHAQHLSAGDPPFYMREYEHLTLVRLLIAQYKNDPGQSSLSVTADLLERLLHAAEEGKRLGSVIEILVLQGLAHHALGDIPAALVALQRAVTLAAPEGYVRMFADEGPPMEELLRALAATQFMPDYTGTVLAACAGTARASGGAQSNPAASVSAPLVEPLSRREREVLRLLATDLSGPEIADALVVSLSTVRTHTKSIYSKLGVTTRRAAVKRAADLAIL